jgi:small subunit ribosomal protein S21
MQMANGRLTVKLHIGATKNTSLIFPKLKKGNQVQELKNLYIFALNFKRTKTKGRHNKMIIIPVKEGENIDKALKKYKRKFEKTGVIKELRERQKYTKPSIIKRQMMMKAIYVEQLRNSLEI